MKILIGMDDSKFSEDVIRSVVGQFKTENTEVLVMHVLQPVEPVAPPQMAPGYAPELDDQKKSAHALVERAADDLRRVGFKTHTVVEVGDVRDSILEAAAKWDADLVVVGSHGQRGIRSLLLGSVAESVARDAKCSVEIVRIRTSH